MEPQIAVRIFRIPGYATQPDKKRLNFRPSDATANPYLAYSALVLMAIDGIKNKIDPEKEGFGPLDVNVFQLSDEERKRIKALPKNLFEVIEAIESDHEYLLSGGVFTKD